MSDCLVPSCSCRARARGLCRTHYENARRAVERGETTWERLEAAGFCTKGNRKGSRNTFAAWAASQLNQPTNQ